MNKFLLNANHIFLKKRLCISVFAIGFFLYSLFLAYIRKFVSIYVSWSENAEVNGNASYSGLINRISSNFSILNIFDNYNIDFSWILITTTITGLLIGLFLWILWPQFLLEKHKGWRRIYVAISIISGLSGFLLCFTAEEFRSAFLWNIISPLLISIVIFSIVVGTLLVMGLRWIFSGFEEKGNV
jgi:hypothetical protein